MDRRETERLLDAIRAAQNAGESAALATIVRVRGSAYRREGTHMFVRRDRTYECALSGGCLEPAVADAAARVIATGDPLLVRYDLSDDSIWGLGIGCMGAVDIRIERLEDDPLTGEWLQVLARGDAAVLVTPLSGASGRLLVRGGGGFVGSIDDPVLQREAIARALTRAHARYPVSGTETIGGAELFFDVATPPPQLVIFGAGPDAPPVAQLAWTLGFVVTVVDVREAFLTAERFPGAALVAAHFGEFARKAPLPPGGFALVMNHHLERDREALRYCLASEVAYIGALGPRSRWDTLLAELAAEGCACDPRSLARVHSPVGLAIGAETPQEVAVSVLGEILAVRRGFDGGFLNGVVRSLHVPDDSRVFARS